MHGGYFGEVGCRKRVIYLDPLNWRRHETVRAGGMEFWSVAAGPLREKRFSRTKIT